MGHATELRFRQFSFNHAWLVLTRPKTGSYLVVVFSQHAALPFLFRGLLPLLGKDELGAHRIFQ